MDEPRSHSNRTAMPTTESLWQDRKLYLNLVAVACFKLERLPAFFDVDFKDEPAVLIDRKRFCRDDLSEDGDHEFVHEVRSPERKVGDIDT